MLFPSKHINDIIEPNPRWLATEILTDSCYSGVKYFDKEDALTNYIDDLCRWYGASLTPENMVIRLARERYLPYRCDREVMKSYCKKFLDWFNPLWIEWNKHYREHFDKCLVPDTFAMWLEKKEKL